MNAKRVYIYVDDYYFITASVNGVTIMRGNLFREISFLTVISFLWYN